MAISRPLVCLTILKPRPSYESQPQITNMIRAASDNVTARKQAQLHQAYSRTLNAFTPAVVPSLGTSVLLSK